MRKVELVILLFQSRLPSPVDVHFPSTSLDTLEIFQWKKEMKIRKAS